MTLPLYDLFAGVPTLGILAGVLVVVFTLGYTGAPFWVWALAGAVGLYGGGAPLAVGIPYVVVVAVFIVRPIRRRVSASLMKLMEALQFLPTISETEQTAIDAGSVWMDGELFSGAPDFEKTLDQLYPELSDEEQAFLDGPCEEACAMVDDWDVHQRGDLSAETWDYLKEEGFFGLIIPEEYGGMGFSAAGRTAVVQKLGSYSVPLAITVMVPNSLGPGELLLHYGTDKQKEYYLPRLATGDLIPAFALTEPNAGSDAGAMEARGEVFRDDDGDLKIRLNWEKRYISLAAISGILGLAFKLHDPENHLGKGEDLGITCALIPTNLPRVQLGRRHDPLGVAFYNCPTEGDDVVVPVDAIIGGRDGAGRGWAMLMDALSAGRGLMMPAQATGGAKAVTRIAGAHAAVREQFGISIGKFEGVEEPLARIAGFTYLMDAARRYTCGGVDQGEKPSVVSAIMKYQTTELQRDLVNDGMDILAGNGISRGPSNLLGLAYQSLPISITVEGANILTRTMMIFGQGAIRCHPYALKEIEALMDGDVKKFDEAFWAHVGHVVRNGFRALGLSLTRGRLAGSPVSGPAAPYYRKMSWAAASFAFFADLAMGSLGGMLKRKEKITGRFADVLSWLYLGTAVLARFEKEGRPSEQEPFLHWSMQYAFAQIQKAFEGLFENLRIPGLTWLLRAVVAPWARINTFGSMPGDELGGTLAQAIQQKDGAREWLTVGAYAPEDPEEPLGELERVFQLSRDAYHVGQKIKDAVRDGDLPKKRAHELLEEAREEGIITQEEFELVGRADEAREQYIRVDSFAVEDYRHSRMLPGKPTERGAFASSIVTDAEPGFPGDDSRPDDLEDHAPRGNGAPGVGESEEDPGSESTRSREEA